MKERNIRKETLINYLFRMEGQFVEADSCAKTLLQRSSQAFKAKLDHTMSFVKHSDAFVPLVGSFSTGKSTALNRVIGRSILPEKVSPETAIPAELRFSEDEYMMALDQQNEWHKFPVDALGTLSKDAASYQIVRLYLNEPVLRELEPFVLVDMPGFDSGLDQHNQAILRYITTGALYLYMVNAKAGSLSHQDTRRIDEIVEQGRTVKVFLSMSDLVAPQDLSSSHEFISDQLADITMDDEAQIINKENISPLLKTIEAADASVLFDSIVLPAVKDLYFDVDDQLGTAISALGTHVDDVQGRIEEAESALKKVEQEKERLMADVSEKQLTGKMAPIISKLERELNTRLVELVMHAKAGEERLSKGISDIVRSTLTVELQQLIRKSSESVAYQFTGAIQIDGSGLALQKNDWVDNTASLLETEIMNLCSGNNKHFSNSVKHKEGGNGLMNILSGISLLIPHPVLKVVLAILPGIVAGIFDSIRARRETEQYRKAIASQVIPSVINQVRSEVLQALISIEAEIIQFVAEKMSAQVEQQKAIYAEVLAKSEDELVAFEKNKNMLEEIRQRMKHDANEVIF